MKPSASLPTVVFLALIIVTSAAIGVVSTVGTSAHEAGEEIIKPGSVVVTSTSGLNLSLSLGSTLISTGQAVSVGIDEWNTLPTENVVPSASNWPLPDLTLGPCMTLNFPIGIEIVRGFYTSSNISSAQPLRLSEPGVYMCPAIFLVSSFAFEPNSDVAGVVGSCSSEPCTTENVSVTQDFAGYWTAASTFSSFTLGEYTVVGGDEWGALAILHFAVVEENSTTSTSLGLSLTLSLNTTQLEAGHAINISADIRNILPVVNNVTGASDWASPVFRDWMASTPCPYFAYVLAFSGYYTQGNISSATPLQISPPGLIVPCPAFLAGYYLFQPSSDEAPFFGGEAVLPMRAVAIVSGYYTPGQSYNYSLPSGGISPTPFPAGVYTVVAGDEWGQMAVAHFSVVEGNSATTVILPANTTLEVSSSFDCVAGHYSLNFSVPEQSTLTGGFSAEGPGVTLYVATAQQAASTFQGHPRSWVYSTGLVSSSSFSVVLPPGSYVVWIEGADQGCGSGIVTPLEMLTQVSITEGFTLTSQ